MDSREGAGSRIANEDWYAVGSLYAGQNPRRVADDGITVNRVASSVFSGLRLAALINKTHVRTVDLPTTG
jgi:hypothetical protein